MKILVALAFIAIVGSLASALVYMMKGREGEKPGSGRMVRALAIRVGVSVLLFLCVLIAWKLGYIQPTGIPAGR